jgi:hypothetical protein
MSVMVSYSRDDWDRVEPIVTFLEASGLNVWIDQNAIPAAADWRAELLRAARRASALVPFLSRHYVASEMCRMELFVARSFDVPIFPVMLEECWDLLDSEEETKYVAAISIARMEPPRVVGLSVSRDEVLSRLVRAVRARSSRPARAKHNVYISYPDGSAEFATRVHAALAERRLRPWIATMDSEVGDDWRRAQVQAMASARAHVIVMTEDFLSRNDVLRTEVLMSEVFELPTLCVMSPRLSSEKQLFDKVRSRVLSGDKAFQRLDVHQWFRPEDVTTGLIHELRRVMRWNWLKTLGRTIQRR